MKKRLFYLIISLLLIASLVLATLLAANLLPRRAPVSDNRNGDGSAGGDPGDTEKDKEDGDTATGRETIPAAGEQGDTDAGGGKEDMKDDISSGENELGRENGGAGDRWISRESINIVNNSPEYELEMYLCYDKDNFPFLEAFYYMDGRSESALYSSSEIPSLKDTGDSPGGAGKPVITKGILNTKYARLYFFVENRLSTGEILFDFYEIDLKNKSPRKLHGAKAYGLSELVFSPDKEYAAYSYLADSDGKESFLQVLNSSTGSFLVIDNKTPDGEAIGRGEDDGKIYSYFIDRWRSNDELRLKEYSRSLDEGKSQQGNEVEMSVVFNVKEGRVIYPDDGIPGGEGAGLAKEDKTGERDTGERDTGASGKAGEGEAQGGSAAEGDGGISGEGESQGESGEGKELENQGTGEGVTGGETGEPVPGNQQPDDQQAGSQQPEEGQLEGSQPEDQQPGGQQAGETGKQPGETSAVPVLESFYVYVNGREYDKAYDLIDD
ncbi:MAG: hypothetical protein GX754_05895, partial [Clostridiaceae bacterium]|nr:hypothetical protein [Clostridiaceae bacterium]